MIWSAEGLSVHAASEITILISNPYSDTSGVTGVVAGMLGPSGPACLSLTIE